MHTIYLKATDADALWGALANAQLAKQEPDPEDPLNQRPSDAAEDWVPTGAMVWQKADGYDLDIIGDIWQPTGTTDADGMPIMEKLEGYHANIRQWHGEFPDAILNLLPTIPAPTNPVRTWAG